MLEIDYEIFTNFLTYLTTGLVACALIAFFLVKKFRPEQIKVFKIISIGLATGYILGVLPILLFLNIQKHFAEEGFIDLYTFIPAAAFLGAVILCALASLLTAVFWPKHLNALFKICVIILSFALLAILIMQAVKFYSTQDIELSGEIMLYLFSAALIAILAVLTFVFGKKQEGDKTKSITTAALCIAMSFTLSYMRLFELPQGGSVTFASLLPLMIYSFIYGPRKGFFAGFAYGFLQFIQAPWFLHPVQFLLDYPLAFGAIGLTGLIKERGLLKKHPFLQFFTGGGIAVVLRYLSHVISGIFVFGSGDPENYGAVAWSFLYNTFALADFAIVAVVAALLFASRSFNRFIAENSPAEN